jgi:hypothetical protein
MEERVFHASAPGTMPTVDCLTIGHSSVDIHDWFGCEVLSSRKAHNKAVSVEILGRMDSVTIKEFVKILEGGSLKTYTPEKLMDFWLISDALKNVQLCEAIEITLQTHESIGGIKPP